MKEALVIIGLVLLFSFCTFFYIVTHSPVKEEKSKIEYICHDNGSLYTHIGDNVLKVHENSCDVSSDCVVDYNSNAKYKCIDSRVFIRIPNTDIFKEDLECRHVTECEVKE